MTSLVVDCTPWETYKVKGIDVHVKREDLSCVVPGPSFSKIRGVHHKIKALKNFEGVKEVGVLDTVHSKAGWGVSYICNHYGLKCCNFYPVYKREKSEDGTHTLRYNQIQSQELGAQLIPLDAGRSAILMHQAKKIFSFMTDAKGYMMPNALKLPETVEATAREVAAYTPGNLLSGTWVISISSGTIAAGVIRGLYDLDVSPQVILHMGYNRSLDAATKAVYDMSGCWLDDVYMVNEEFDYKDRVVSTAPFPCNEYYDAKAWRWLEQTVQDCEEPIVFWNIGA